MTEAVKEVTDTTKANGQPSEVDIELSNFLLDSPADHEGHAGCVLRLYPGLFIFNESHGWMFYNDRYWQREGAQAAVERAITATLRLRQQLALDAEREQLGKRSWANRHMVNGIREQIKKEKEVNRSIDIFDSDPDHINCNNGVVNLRTGELLNHNSRQYFTYCLPIVYDPLANAGIWLKFLKDATNNQRLLDYIQMAIGYSLTGHTNEEILFYIYGPPRSGKGTFTETLIALLGWPLATEVDFETFTANRYGDTNNFDLAPLKPCRYVAASESNRYGSLNPAKIKQITGGNYIRCSFKRKDHFSYRPQYKIWLSSNHRANVDVDDDAAWSRVRVIEFPQSHLGKEDKTLKQRMTEPETLQGILAWAVAGAMKWYAAENGLVAPKSVERSTAGHRSTLDDIQQFIAERCKVEKGAFTPSATIHQEYKNWCEENGIKWRYQRQFTLSLSAKGFETKQKRLAGKVRRGFVGIAIEEECTAVPL